MDAKKQPSFPVLFIFIFIKIKIKTVRAGTGGHPLSLKG